METFYAVEGRHRFWYYKSKKKAREKYEEEVKSLKKEFNYDQEDTRDWTIEDNYVWYYDVGYEAGDEVNVMIRFMECNFEDETNGTESGMDQRTA